MASMLARLIADAGGEVHDVTATDTAIYACVGGSIKAVKKFSREGVLQDTLAAPSEHTPYRLEFMDGYAYLLSRATISTKNYLTVTKYDASWRQLAQYELWEYDSQGTFLYPSLAACGGKVFLCYTYSQGEYYLTRSYLLRLSTSLTIEQTRSHETQDEYQPVWYGIQAGEGCLIGWSNVWGSEFIYRLGKYSTSDLSYQGDLSSDEYGGGYGDVPSRCIAFDGIHQTYLAFPETPSTRYLYLVSHDSGARKGEYFTSMDASWGSSNGVQSVSFDGCSGEFLAGGARYAGAVAFQGCAAEIVSTKCLTASVRSNAYGYYAYGGTGLRAAETSYKDGGGTQTLLISSIDAGYPLECNLIRLPDSSFVCIFARNSNEVAACVSMDQGLTWGGVSVIMENFQHVSAVLSQSSGMIVAALYRPSEFCWYLATAAVNEAETLEWNDPVKIAGSTGPCCQGCLVEMPDGTWRLLFTDYNGVQKALACADLAPDGTGTWAAA